MASRQPTRRYHWTALACLMLAGACSAAPPVEQPRSSPVNIALAKAAAAETPVVQPASLATGAAGASAAPYGSPAAGFGVSTVLSSERSLEAGDYLWEPDGVSDGPLTVVIDLDVQLLYAYRGGVEIGRAYVIYGDDDKPTPLGTFEILEMKKHHVSNLYNAPMPFMMRLTWDGIAIHGSEVDDEYATHGCIGVPDEFAELLFGKARLGDKVMVTRGWMQNVYSEQVPGDELEPELTEA